MNGDSEELKAGIDLAQSGKYLDALVIFDKLLFRHADSPDLHFLAGAAHHKLGNTEEARRHWGRVLELRPGDPKATQWLSTLPAAPTPHTQSKRKPKGSRGLGGLARFVIPVAVLALAAVGFDMATNPNAYPFLRKERINVQWNWKEGDDHLYKIVIEGGVSTSFGSGEEGGKKAPIPIPPTRIKGNGTFSLRHKVLSVEPDGIAEILLHVEGYSGSMQSPTGESVPFSSDSPTQNSNVVTDLKQTPLKLRVNRQGALLSAHNGAEWLKLFNSAMAGSSGASQINPEDLVDIFAFLFPELPGRSVESGETWTLEERQEMAGMGTMVTSMNFTLGEATTVGDIECLSIDAVGDVKWAPGAGGTPQAITLPEGIQPTIEASSGSGQILYSNEIGRPVSEVGDISMVMSMAIDLASMLGGQTPTGVALPKVSMRIDISMKKNLQLVR